MKRLFFIFLTIFHLVDCSTAQISVEPIRSSLDLQGHRGARGLKPENTWPAFEAAIKFKMTTLELDTVLTKDDYVVIHHDSDTNPLICQNENGTPIEKVSLYELSLSDLKKLDCGSLKNPKFPEQETVPGTKLLTIEEFFQKAIEVEKKEKISLFFNIETKFPDNGSASQEKVEKHTLALLSAISKAKMESKTTVQSFDMRTLAFIKKIKAKVKTSALFAPTYGQGFKMTFGFGDSHREEILSIASELGVEVISPYYLYVTPSFVQKAHSKKMEVIPWTVNEKTKMKQLLTFGVDGIISDYPDRLKEVAEEHNSSQKK